MRALFSLSLFLVTPAFAGMIHRRDGPQPTLAPHSTSKYLYDCDAGAKITEAYAWQDHLAIAKEAIKWKAGSTWQQVFDRYMGKDSKDSPWGNAIKRTLLPKSSTAIFHFLIS